MKVNREEFLLRLETLQPGLTTKGNPDDQSDCFAFSKGKIFTYNDEASCSCPSPDPSLSGVVKADKFLTFLRKLPSDEIELFVEDSYFVVKAKRRTAQFVMEQEIEMLIDRIEEPEKWKPIPKDLLEAISLVGKCSSTATNNFHTACINLNPNWVEASDGQQVCRWKMKTGMPEPVLVRFESVKQCANLGMIEWGETKGWLHFRNDNQLRLSCRRYIDEEYPQFDSFLTEKGVPISLPKGLAEASELAHIFSKENPESDKVQVSFTSNGKVYVRSSGDVGTYNEWKKTEYDGKPIAFHISPEVLIDVISQYHDFILTPNTLRAEPGVFVYATVLDIAVPEGE